MNRKYHFTLLTCFVLFLLSAGCSRVTRTESGPIPPSKNASIEFRFVCDDPCEGGRDYTGLHGYVHYALEEKVQLSTADIRHFYRTRDEYGQLIIGVVLTPPATEKFQRITRNSNFRRLAIVVNGKVLMAPRIREEIINGQIYISGDFTEKEIRDIMDSLTR